MLIHFFDSFFFLSSSQSLSLYHLTHSDIVHFHPALAHERVQLNGTQNHAFLNIIMKYSPYKLIDTNITYVLFFVAARFQLNALLLWWNHFDDKILSSMSARCNDSLSRPFSPTGISSLNCIFPFVFVYIENAPKHERKMLPQIIVSVGPCHVMLVNHWHNTLLLTHNLLLNSAWAVIQHQVLYFCTEETRCWYLCSCLPLERNKYFTKCVYTGSAIEFRLNWPFLKWSLRDTKNDCNSNNIKEKEKRIERKKKLYNAHENVLKIYCPKVL